jgi:hypothetical protein
MSAALSLCRIVALLPLAGAVWVCMKLLGKGKRVPRG